MASPLAAVLAQSCPANRAVPVLHALVAREDPTAADLISRHPQLVANRDISGMLAAHPSAVMRRLLFVSRDTKPDPAHIHQAVTARRSTRVWRSAADHPTTPPATLAHIAQKAPTDEVRAIAATHPSCPTDIADDVLAYLAVNLESLSHRTIDQIASRPRPRAAVLDSGDSSHVATLWLADADAVTKPGIGRQFLTELQWMADHDLLHGAAKNRALQLLEVLADTDMPVALDVAAVLRDLRGTIRPASLMARLWADADDATRRWLAEPVRWGPLPDRTELLLTLPGGDDVLVDVFTAGEHTQPAAAAAAIDLTRPMAGVTRRLIAAIDRPAAWWAETVDHLDPDVVDMFAAELTAAGWDPTLHREIPDIPIPTRTPLTSEDAVAALLSHHPDSVGVQRLLEVADANPTLRFDQLDAIAGTVAGV